MTNQTKRADRKNLLFPILAVLLAELVFVLVRFAADFRTGPAVTMGPDRLEPAADSCVVTEQGVHVESFTGWFARTAPADLPAGSYRVVVTYSNNGQDGQVRLLGEDAVTARWDAAVLPAARTRTMFDLWLPYGCRGAQVEFYADCAELRALNITGVQFVPTRARAYLRLLTAVLLFALADLAALIALRRLPLPGRNAEQRAAALAVGCILLFACMPLGLGYLTYGHDLSIHLARIEGLKAGLLSGQFPVRMDPALLNDKGYPFSLMYSDLFLFPAALLRLAGVPLETCYKWYLFGVTLATVLLTRWVLRRMLGSEKIALLGAALYALSFYRLINVYVRAAVGEYTAMTFLPLVVYGLWRIYSQPARPDRRAEPLCWLPLALGFTGLLQSHLLTTGLAGLFTLLFCLVRFRQTFSRPVLPALCRAAGAAVLWNLWFLVPLGQYMAQGVCAISGTYDASALYDSAVYPAQMFTLLGQAGGTVQGIRDGMEGEMSQSVGLVLAVGAVFLLPALLRPDLRRENKTAVRVGTASLGFGLLALFCASTLFPWYSLYRSRNAAAKALSALLGKLQFAWRFLTPATVLLVFCACCGTALFLRADPAAGRRMAGVLLAMTVLSAGYLLYDKCENSAVRTYLSLAAVDTPAGQIGGGEYLPASYPDGVNGADGDLEPVCSGEAVLEAYEKNGLTITLTAANPGTGQAFLRLPLFDYPGYQMTGGGDGAVLTGRDGVLVVAMDPGWRGTVTVRWQGMWLWRMADAVSLAAIAATAWLLRKRRQSRRQSRRQPH